MPRIFCVWLSSDYSWLLFSRARSRGFSLKYVGVVVIITSCLNAPMLRESKLVSKEYYAVVAAAGAFFALGAFAFFALGAFAFFALAAFFALGAFAFFALAAFFAFGFFAFGALAFLALGAFFFLGAALALA